MSHRKTDLGIPRPTKICQSSARRDSDGGGLDRMRNGACLWANRVLPTLRRKGERSWLRLNSHDIQGQFHHSAYPIERLSSDFLLFFERKLRVHYFN